MSMDIAIEERLEFQLKRLAKEHETLREKIAEAQTLASHLEAERQSLDFLMRLVRSELKTPHVYENRPGGNW